MLQFPLKNAKLLNELLSTRFADADIPTPTTGQAAVYVDLNSQLRIKNDAGVVTSIATIPSNTKVILVSKADKATDNRTGLSKYDNTYPFATIQAAITAWASGDCIIVQPGTYAENLFILNNGNIYFHHGVVVSGPVGIRPKKKCTVCKLLRQDRLLFNVFRSIPITSMRLVFTSYPQLLLKCKNQLLLQNMMPCGHRSLGICI